MRLNDYGIKKQRISQGIQYNLCKNIKSQQKYHYISYNRIIQKEDPKTSTTTAHRRNEAMNNHDEQVLTQYISQYTGIISNESIKMQQTRQNSTIFDYIIIHYNWLHSDIVNINNDNDIDYSIKTIVPLDIELFGIFSDFLDNLIIFSNSTQILNKKLPKNAYGTILITVTDDDIEFFKNQSKKLHYVDELQDFRLHIPSIKNVLCRLSDISIHVSILFIYIYIHVMLYTIKPSLDMYIPRKRTKMLG